MKVPMRMYLNLSTSYLLFCDSIYPYIVESSGDIIAGGTKQSNLDREILTGWLYKNLNVNLIHSC